MAGDALDLVFPPSCLVCRSYEEIDRTRMLCLHCWDELFHPAAVPLVGAPQTLSVLSAGEFRGTLRELIHRAKFSADPLPLRTFVRLLEKTLDAVGDTQFDVVTAVPGSSRRIRERGIDLPGVIARRLARVLGIPFDRTVLQRMKDVPPQTSLSRIERLKNLEGVFCVGTNDLKLVKILVVDDVTTTGATSIAVARALETADPTSVTFLAIARTLEEIS
ncbi:MAG: double zinc ribbon domain-containing protein [Pseudomonadota bacterium]